MVDSSKWLIAKRKGNNPIKTTRLRFSTKKQAEKKASKLNKAFKGTKIKFLVRRVGWRRKRWHS